MALQSAGVVGPIGNPSCWPAGRTGNPSYCHVARKERLTNSPKMRVFGLVATLGLTVPLAYFTAPAFGAAGSAFRYVQTREDIGGNSNFSPSTVAAPPDTSNPCPV